MKRLMRNIVKYWKNLKKKREKCLWKGGDWLRDTDPASDQKNQRHPDQVFPDPDQDSVKVGPGPALCISASSYSPLFCRLWWGCPGSWCRASPLWPRPCRPPPPPPRSPTPTPPHLQNKFNLSKSYEKANQILVTIGGLCQGKGVSFL